MGGARHGSGTRPGWMTEMIERWKEGPCEICKTHNNSEEEEGSGGTGCRRLVSLPDPPSRSQFDLSPEDDPIAAQRAGRASPTRPAPTGRGSPRPVGSRGRAKSLDKTARIWDVITGEEVVRTLEGHGDRVLCVAWSPDGRRVATGSWDGTARIWDATTGTVARTPVAAD